jgi:hypothetical protein
MSITHLHALRSSTISHAQATARSGAATRRARRLAAASALLAAGLSIGGCNSAGTDHASAGSGASASAQAPGSAAQADCGSVSADRVKTALGITVSAPTADKQGNTVVCQYAAGGNPMQVSIRFETGSTLEEMQSLRKTGDGTGVKSHDLTGLGDAAYTTSLSAPRVPTVNSVVAQKGNLNVQVTAPAAIPVIKALVAQLIP